MANSFTVFTVTGGHGITDVFAGSAITAALNYFHEHNPSSSDGGVMGTGKDGEFILLDDGDMVVTVKKNMKETKAWRDRLNQPKLTGCADVIRIH